jgi:hypothetical protein
MSNPPPEVFISHSADARATASLIVRPLPSLAKSLAVRRLAEMLEQRGHHPHAAQAIAVGVCDPAVVRRQLEQPGELRVAEGTLEVIYTSVWAPSVLTYPTNARALPAFSYPIEGRADRRNPLTRPIAAEDGASELVLRVRDRVELVGVLDLELSYLRDHNNLFESVIEHGVREPLTLVPLTIEQSGHDGKGSSNHDTSVCVLTAVDGSSRTAAVYQAQKLEPTEILFHLAGNDRLLRQRVQHVLALLDEEVSRLEVDELARLRTLVLPAAIVVGFRPDPGSRMDLAGAIESRLGSLHVDPPREWSTASRLDVQVDAVLQHLVDRGHIPQAEGEWLAGRLTPDEAQEHGFTKYPDVRAARWLELVNEQKRIVSMALRSLVSRRIVVRRQDRVEVAAEAALRPFRSRLSESAASAARNVLQTTFAMPELMKPWQVHTQPRKSVQIRDEAMRELQDDGRPGPATRELLVLALYWMSRYSLIRKTTRGGEADRRNISDVLTQLLHTQHGVIALHRIVLDGRNGRVPRRVDAVGGFILSADGEGLPVSEQWIRANWRPAGSSTTSASGSDEEPPMSPEADLARRRARLRASIAEVTGEMHGLEQPKDQEGTPLVRMQGLPLDYVNEVMSMLFEIQGRLSYYRQVAIDHGDHS